MSLTREQRQLRGRIGALTMHARGSTNTAPAREAFLARFERQVDPDGVLPPEERARRAELAKSAHFAALAFRSSTTRSRAARSR